MKVVILAGGRGTRISEESAVRPKPMVTVGGMPILWHIMKIYASFGFYEFIICCGYKGEYIKKYFVDYNLNGHDAAFDLRNAYSKPEQDKNEDINKEPWDIILANTGLHTLTAGRILKIKDYLGDDEEFLLTYGDGVADIDLIKLLAFHRQHKKTVTISATRPEGRFGAVSIDESGIARGFKEKARRNESYVNMGFMVMKKNVFSYLGDGSSMLEDLPFERLAADGEMAVYQHEGFWSPMDNINDRAYLEKLWADDLAYWKLWKE